jgi:RNA polymerase sigma-70 factor (ECF subfamily)
MDTCKSQDEATLNPVATATDEALVAAAKLGDRPAFAELWERHSNKAFTMAYRIARNRDDADDVIQEAWLKAYVHLKRFDGRAQFRLGSHALLSIRRS